MTTFERIAAILKVVGVKPELITSAATLNSMGIDSMDQVDLAVMIELEFKVDLESERFQKVLTIGELEFEIERHLARAAA